MSARNTLFALPNLLTYGRILAIPLVLALLALGDAQLRWIALALYVVAAVTDWFDGYLARRDNLISPLGQMLDPIADKMLVCALLVVFAWDGTFSATDLIPACAILLREVFVSGLREFLGGKGISLKVTRLAKYKTTVQMLAMVALFLDPLLPVSLGSDLLLWLAGLLTLWTGIDYLAKAWPHLVAP